MPFFHFEAAHRRQNRHAQQRTHWREATGRHSFARQFAAMNSAQSAARKQARRGMGGVMGDRGLWAQAPGKGQVTTAGCLTRGLTRDGHCAMTIVLVPYEFRGRKARSVGYAEHADRRRGREPISRAAYFDPPLEHTWWPRDSAACVAIGLECHNIARDALGTIDAADISGGPDGASRVSDAVYREALWPASMWGGLPLTAYAMSWLVVGGDNWPPSRPYAPTAASVHMPWPVAGLPDVDNVHALVCFERLVGARQAALQEAIMCGHEPYTYAGMRLMSQRIRHFERRFRECHDTVKGLCTMRKQLYANNAYRC
ncbi:hypothetical protein psal_cds_167 [Pandoravirus salinus]|uniref:Uncharacterized protein n=1 Tax=Pandoravirus salinus TaxID=1349410 RepID=S4VZZ5_9VIRU|nr:hypothetical protein psal_cds_167 [Pandoravirus salinus]AGO83652.1 hypothetical protein psal_cds_167 [Pandoravirus salinus]